MHNMWFAIEDRASVAALKKAGFEPEINAVWFPANGTGPRPFPYLLSAVQHADHPIDLLIYESAHQPLPSISLMRAVPTLVSLDPAPLRSFGRENSRTNSLFLTERLNGERGRIAQALRHAAGLVVWSEWARQELVGNFGIEPEKILVTRTGVDLAEWDNTRRDFQIARRPERGLPERIRVLFAGDDFENQGGALLLKVFKSDPELAGRCELHLITRRTGAVGHLENRGAGLEPEVYLHPGHTPAEVYLNADIYVAPARQAFSPAQLATALAAGLPVIASPVGGLTELVRDNFNGLLVPPDNAPALAQALWNLVEDPARRNRLGQRSREVAEAQFDAAANSQQVVNFGRKVAARPGLAGPAPARLKVQLNPAI